MKFDCCNCYRRNISDEDLESIKQEARIRLHSRDYIVALELYDQGIVTVDTLVIIIRRIETQAKEEVSEELRNDPNSFYLPAEPKQAYPTTGSVLVNYPAPNWRQRYPGEILQKRVHLPQPGSSFHLSPCSRCGCPSWQEPCPFCNFYRDRYTQPDRPEHIWPVEHYLRFLRSYKTFFEFYAKRQAVRRVEEYMPIAELITQRMLTIGEQVLWWPSKLEIYRAYGYIPCEIVDCHGYVHRTRYVPTKKAGGLGGIYLLVDNYTCNEHRV
jgi:hypothetical protein